jgi:hypothetical protein
MHKRDRRSPRTQGRPAPYPSPSTNFHLGEINTREHKGRGEKEERPLLSAAPNSPCHRAAQPLRLASGDDDVKIGAARNVVGRP